MLFHVDFALKIKPIAQLHKLMRVPGVAVFTCKLTSPIRIDHPGKRHSSGIAFGYNAAVGDRKIVYLMAFSQSFALGCKAGNSDQWRWGFIFRKERRHKGPCKFPFYSPFLNIGEYIANYKSPQ